MRRMLILALGASVALAVAGSPAPSAAKEKEKAKPEQAAVKRARKTVRMLDDVYKQAIVLITDKYVKTKKDYPAGRAAIKWLNDIGKKLDSAVGDGGTKTGAVMCFSAGV